MRYTKHAMPMSLHNEAEFASAMGSILIFFVAGLLSGGRRRRGATYLCLCPQIDNEENQTLETVQNISFVKQILDNLTRDRPRDFIRATRYRGRTIKHAT